MPDKNNRPKQHLASPGTIVCGACGVIALAVNVLLCLRTTWEPRVILLGTLSAYVFVLALTALLGLLSRNHGKEGGELHGSVLGALLLDFLQRCSFPVLLCDESGKIAWYNTALSAQFHSHNVLYGKYIDNICDATIEGILKEKNGLELSFLSDKEVAKEDAPVFSALGYRVSLRGKTFYIAMFEDISEKKGLLRQLKDEETLVAYVIIDNLEELVQHMEDQYSAASNDVEAILRADMEKVGGVIRKYSYNKFVCVFAAKHLKTFTKERFAVLDAVREIRVAESSLPVTISIGIAALPGTLAEKERATQAALDMALQRGGDQVVLKTPDGVEFYGGKTKTVQKRTKVRARVIASELLMLISSSSNVIVMGHRFADFDALASCLAVVRLARFCGVPAVVVVDRNDHNLDSCFARLKGPEYQNLFVDKIEAQDLVRSDTLAVAVDVNNLSFAEAPDVLNTVENLVVIDHHRKVGEFTTQPKIAYIEPSASSASELLSEFLEQILPQGTLPKVEADLLLAGILLDTKRFTHNTGVRTFSSALYLRGEGASPIDAQDLFKVDIDNFLSESQFENNVMIYRSIIAIALNEDNENSSLGKVNAARAADRLLSVEGVQAAFALCVVDDTVHISARSQSKINVQLILEKMGGGGHFDAAGAQVRGETVKDTLARLRAAIDEYLEENNIS